MQTLCAQWDEQTQTPYNITPIERLILPNSNGVPPKDWATRNRAGFYHYIPVQLGDGEGLDNPTYAFSGGVIRQGGTVVSAAEMQARQAQARKAAMAAMLTPDVVGLAVAYRDTLRAMFGPLAEVNRNVTQGVVVGTLLQLPPEQYDAKTADLLKLAYETLSGIAGDGTTWTFYETVGDLIPGGE